MKINQYNELCLNYQSGITLITNNNNNLRNNWSITIEIDDVTNREQDVMVKLTDLQNMISDFTSLQSSNSLKYNERNNEIMTHISNLKIEVINILKYHTYHEMSELTSIFLDYWE